MNRAPRGTGIVLSIAAWLGLGLQLVLTVRLTYQSATPSLPAALVAHFGYFTIITNLFVALVAGAELANGRWAWVRTLARRTVAGCAAALHYSRRSAALAAQLAERAGFADPFFALLHVCLSADVGEPLRAHGAARLVFASEPREDRLIDALERALT